MSNLFNPKMTKYVNDKLDWVEVINKGVEILVENGYAKQTLADAILESTKQFGAYYVLERGLALLHAAPGDYALKNGTSVMILDDFVRFNNQEDKEARIIVTLSAVDSSSHLNILQEFSHYFMNDEFK
ncbi:PTS sugar transporter subunit IIA, partial [Mycoplasmopsis pullorum]